MNNTQTITRTINEKIKNKDKNGNNYLILKLNNKETIFVFPSKVDEERWSWLEEGKEYNFTVEEGRDNNSAVLVDFEIEINN